MISSVAVSDRGAQLVGCAAKIAVVVFIESEAVPQPVSSRQQGQRAL
jgi:hypothetical protein